jgi:hypothetical protein
MERNNIMLVNESSNEFQDLVFKIIDNSNLSDFEKSLEKDFARNVLSNGVLNLDFLRNNINATKFQKLYAYLAGYTNINTVETPQQLQVNKKFFSKLGDLASKPIVQSIASAVPIPGVGAVASILPKVTGTSTTCGVLGGLFNTKKCREKQNAQQNSATQFLQQQATKPTSIAQPTQAIAVQPQVQPQLEQQLERQQRFSAAVNSEPQQPKKNNKILFIAIGAGVLLLVVLFFVMRKKRR